MPEVITQQPGRILTFGENMILLSGGGLPGGGGSQEPTTPAPAQSSQDAGSGQPTQTPSSQSSTPTTQTAPGPSYGTPTSSQIQVPQYAPPAGLGPYGDLFKSLTQGVGEAYQGLGGLAGEFSQEAGPYRSFEAEQPKLEQALSTRTATPEAKALLGASYQGPKALQDVNAETSDRLTQSVGALEGQRRALGGGTGVQDLLSQYAPGITPGEARFESRRLAGEPGFQSALGAVRGDISNLYGSLYGISGQAEAIGKARQEQEQGIAKQAGEFLTAREATERAPLQAEIDRLAAERQATMDAWNRFQDTGDWRALQGQTIQEGDVGRRAEDLYSPQAQLLDRGKARQAGIMAQFPDLKDIPLMQMGSTGTGRQTLQFDSEWWEAHKGEHSDSEWATIKQQARLRNKELVEAGFSPFAQDYRTPEVSFTSQGPGEYGQVMPMYMALQNFAPEDLRAYLALQNLPLPSIENVSTKDQRAVLNTIRELRGMQERVEAADPYQAAVISGEVDRYLKEAEAQGRAILEQGKAGGQEFLNAVSRERDAEKKRKKQKSFMGRVGSAGIGTLKHDPTAILRGAGVLK